MIKKRKANTRKRLQGAKTEHKDDVHRKIDLNFLQRKISWLNYVILQGVLNRNHYQYAKISFQLTILLASFFGSPVIGVIGGLGVT